MTAPATAFLFSLERFGMKFGLANMVRLCQALGHPERACPSIHVAGTNGKGSVAAMVDTALRAAGRRCARYTSPHLARLEERFVIDGEEVSGDRLEAAARRVMTAIDALLASGALEGYPTFFEATTAAAFELFRDAAVEVAVVEAGLGGRLDATNVITPIATAIVSIDFDHQAQLGDTLASIAAEKAGIIKPGVPVVCGAMPAEAMQVIAQTAANAGAPLLRADGADTAARVAAVALSLAGAHQRANAAVALRLLETIDGDPQHGIRVPEAARLAGLGTAVWPGRLETIRWQGRPILLDAAHNPAGARALASYLAALAPQGGVTLVFGAMKDKDVDRMLYELAPVVQALICTTAPTARAMPAHELADLARSRGIAADAVDAPIEALAHALAAPCPIVVAGSIFLIGAVREQLRRDILR